MQIRTYQPGDEVVQAEIYNEAAHGLPKFKPATAEDVARRCRAPDFDPSSRFYALADGRLVGYAVFNADGRVSVPWCRPGQEAAAEALFARVLQTMKERGLKRAYAAYRGDWPGPKALLEKQGFFLAREMINYALELSDMGTRMDRPHLVSPLKREDVPTLLRLGPRMLRVQDAAALERYLFENPYFSPDSLFGIRSQKDGQVLAAGLLIRNSAYADPFQVDANMPCFRLGAFGTEGMHTKRISGMFSVLTSDDFEGRGQAHLLMGYAALQLEKDDLYNMAAQAPSDMPHLTRFYKQQFRRQGSFPVYEKALAD